MQMNVYVHTRILNGRVNNYTVLVYCGSRGFHLRHADHLIAPLSTTTVQSSVVHESTEGWPTPATLSLPLCTVFTRRCAPMGTVSSKALTSDGSLFKSGLFVMNLLFVCIVGRTYLEESVSMTFISFAVV